MTRSTSKGVALVTGAANGIGKGIALRLAADGFDVPVNDVESNLAELEALARELRSVGRRTAAVVADVSNGPFAFYTLTRTLPVRVRSSASVLCPTSRSYVRRPI
jgi:NAD(P)-dependent dehydrogenase (short-subunit alcohol dehydrogenase family)